MNDWVGVMMTGLSRTWLAAVCSVVVGAAAPAMAQNVDAIRIVGSSTVFPFSAAVAEQFGAKTDFPTPVVESTGTGGGLKLFCDGLGREHPDIANASRRIKVSEFRRCLDNGVSEVVEIKVGFDGIVLANAEEAPAFAVSREQIFRALARRIPTAPDDCTLIDNPHQTWFDVDPSLPPFPIEVFGPPATSGTRDAFVEIAMEPGAWAVPCLDGLAALHQGVDETAEDYLKRVQRYWPTATLEDLTVDDGASAEDGAPMALLSGDDWVKAVAYTLRDDGGWIDAGENDNAIVNTLVETPTALGVFGFSFLDQNEDRLKGALVDGVAPVFEAIESGDYSIARSLYFYLKRGHLDVTPGLRAFAMEFTSEAATGAFGYLDEKGLIPLSSLERERYAAAARELPVLTLDEAGAFAAVLVEEAPRTPDGAIGRSAAPGAGADNGDDDEPDAGEDETGAAAP